MPESIELSAYAKVNLALSVGGPVPPKGYHPIASWFACVELADRIVLERNSRPGLKVQLRWASDAPRPTEIDWPMEKDLGVRAVGALETHVGRSLPVKMLVEKRVPVGGGLGGGSADAAGVLVGLNALYELGLSAEVLASIGSTLGSDVPFFIDEAALGNGPATAARMALVTGFGEKLERVEQASRLRGVSVVLIMPACGCPTGAVYAAFDAEITRAGRLDQGADEARVRGLITSAVTSGRVDGETLFNDLASPAETVEPRVKVVREKIGAALGPTHQVHITGSGSTMFVVVNEGEDVGAVEAAARGAGGGEVAVVRAKVL